MFHVIDPRPVAPLNLDQARRVISDVRFAKRILADIDFAMSFHPDIRQLAFLVCNASRKRPACQLPIAPTPEPPKDAA